MSSALEIFCANLVGSMNKGIKLCWSKFQVLTRPERHVRSKVCGRRLRFMVTLRCITLILICIADLTN